MTRSTSLLAFALALVPCVVSAEERPVASPTPAETPRPEPIRPEPEPTALRRVTSEPLPTPTRTPTPLRRPKLVAALESVEDADTERVAVFDDGTLVFVQGYKGRRVVRRKELTRAEVDLVRKVCADALALPAPWGIRERALSDLKGRRVRVEVADADGRSRSFETDDLTPLPLAVGRAKGALEDFRARFFEVDPKETRWDPTGVRKGDFLRYRSDGSWYVVVRDDAFEPSLEVQEVEGIGNRMLLLRDQLPGLFENPAEAGAPPTPRR